jgi:hypothetical protein
MWLLGFGVSSAQIEMPDPSLIHGRAIPAPELAAGTVTVRVVREAIGNNIADQEVTVVLPDGQRRTALTDTEGRAEFPGLPPVGGARAEAVVDGEALVSEQFAVPSSGGLRVILVAGLAAATERRKEEETAGLAAPAVSGAVVLGGNSRVVMEFQDDRLQVFYVLEVLNNARTRVDIGGPLIIELPTGAGGAGVMQGSSPSVSVSGDTVTVTGPFAPGATSVQVGFTLDSDSPEYTLVQEWPVALQQVTVAVEKVGNLNVTSQQFAAVEERASETGTPFLVANGPALPAGGVLTLQLSGLPAHSPMPRYVTLGITAAILGFGAWLAFSARPKGDDRRRLISRRDSLLGELAALEERRQKGIADARYSTRRQRILTELEHIYGELDEAGSGPGGDEGVAA